MRDVLDPSELIFRRVRGILNKLTPENFDKLSYELLNIGIDKTILKGIIILVYEKAIDEAKYCNLYAQLCHRLRHDVPNFDDADKKTNTFTRLLLSKCQEEFETRSKATSAFDRKDSELSPEELQDKHIAKRKMLGNIKFIGELGKHELLQEAILHKCIQQLLAKKKRTSLSEMAEDIECMCQIMSTIGKRLDTAKAMNIMNQYFDRIEMLSQSSELPSRIRFMLRDLMELRKNEWVPRRNLEENGPRSVSQMRWEEMGMMVPPPFPFFPGMPLPPGMPQHPIGMPPYTANGDLSAMPWFNDQVLSCGGMISSDSKLPADYHDETKDIFGKPVNKTPAVKTHTPLVTKPMNKQDLFEPHYMKSKANGNRPMVNGKSSSVSQKTKPNPTEEKKVINKNNPWNIDPFVPKFSKPSISLITQTEEAIKNNNPPTNVSTPPQRISPQTIPRNSAANVYQKQQTQQQQQAWRKNNSDVSLRPASSLTNKKEEKPKIGINKAEELPGKQFTNLTIETKSIKPKKTGLSKSDVEKSIIEMNECHKADRDNEKACNDLQSLTTNLKYSKMVAKQLFLFTSAQSKDDWGRLSGLVLECVNKSIFSIDTLINIYNQLLGDLKLIESENGKDFMALIASAIVENGLYALNTLMENFDDGAYHPTALLCLAKLNKAKGKDWLLSLLLEHKINLIKIFPKNEQSDTKIMKVAQEMEMTFLFPHLCLKEDLMKMMKQGVSENDLVKWVKENENSLSRKQLVHMVVTCAVTYATEQTFEKCCDLQQKPDKEIQEKEKECLQKLNTFLHTVITGQDLNDQLEAVYALQVFCHENEFPKDMLLRMFLCFYNMEIIDEDVFLKWKEDINDSYPGKGKSLFQVNNWLQWLETADEEEEEDDDENEVENEEED